MHGDGSGRDPLEGTPYRGLTRIGAGASGEVWEAMHQKLAKRVVVKLLKREHTASREQVDRLRLEAQSLARLAHSNVVRVTDSGLTPDGRAFVVMEHLRGQTLGWHIESEGALPAAQAVDIMTQLLAGMAAAHELGIVHRDIKPDNVLLCGVPGSQPVVKLLDFGLVKTDASAEGPTPLDDPTAEGVSVGTPRYFSPEQARALPVDARSDVYACGLVLHSMLYGRGPFDDLVSVPELARAHAKMVPRLPRIHAAEPAATELRQVLRRALEKTPGRRFQTAAQMGQALRLIGEHLDRPPWSTTLREPPPAAANGRQAGGSASRASYAAVLIATLVLVGALSSMVLRALG